MSNNDDVIGTLFEGDYHIGAAALLNSLCLNGFKGKVVCGYRGDPPPWQGEVGLWAPIEVELQRLDPPVHFTAYKSRWLVDLIDTYRPGRVHYIDPDIVLCTDWSLIARWASNGIALAEDINGDQPANDPRRLLQRDFLAASGLQSTRHLSTYFNGGYVGIDARYESFLSVWQQVIDIALAVVGPMHNVTMRPRDQLFSTPDQDALNAALEIDAIPINSAPRSAMGFSAAGPLLLAHAIGEVKPWRYSPLSLALDGRSVSLAHRAFYNYAGAPFPALSRAQLRRVRRQMKLASAITRFYHRPQV
jgi:hypothetical protein